MLFFPRGIIVTLAATLPRRGGRASQGGADDGGAHPRDRGLSKRFGGVVATDSVTLAVAPGELRCIIGPNGAGKSTLFSLLCGIHRPDAGRILLKGQDVTRLPAVPARAARPRPHLPDQPRLPRPVGPAEPRSIAEAARPRRPAAEAEGALSLCLELFGLDPTCGRPARELPHHQLQWLEIAMVLAGGPDILLLDEPTAGMSPEETLQTARVLQHLNETGLTIVVVEHDIAFVREVAQRRDRAAPGPGLRRGHGRRDHRARRTCAASIWAGLSMAAILRRQRPAGRLCHRRRAAGRRPSRSRRARSSACSAATASARAR